MHAPSSMHIAYSSGSSARLPERIIGPATISFLFVVDTAWVWMLVVQNHPWTTTTTTTIIKKDTSNCTHFICSDTLFYGKQQHIVGCVKPISAAAAYYTVHHGLTNCSGLLYVCTQYKPIYTIVWTD